MPRISDLLRDIDISGFKPIGIFQDDVPRFCEYAGLSTNNPHLVALRLAFGDTITTHRLTDGVCKKIINTKIENLPEGRPDFLKSPFLLEAKDGCLLHNIHTLGGYIDNGVLVILSFFNDDSFLVQVEYNSFSGMALSEINFKNSTGYNRCGEEKNRDTLPFLAVLAIMLEAERTPISIDDGNKKSKKRNNSGKRNNTRWIERRVYIDAKYQHQKKETPGTPLDKDGKELKSVRIQGFLRHQAYGPGHKLRKYIYVEDFDSSRWTNPANTRVTVDLYHTDTK